MRSHFSLFLGFCSVLLAQTTPPAFETKQVRNLTHSLRVVSCERPIGANTWMLTIQNISDSPIGYVTIDGAGESRQGTDLLFPNYGLAPGATYTIRLGGVRPEGPTILSAVSIDGKGDGSKQEIADTLAFWLGQSVQNQSVAEIMKSLTVDDTDQTVDMVLGQLNALPEQPDVTNNTKLQALMKTAPAPNDV
jgi:hypothetical protein